MHSQVMTVLVLSALSAFSNLNAAPIKPDTNVEEEPVALKLKKELKAAVTIEVSGKQLPQAVEMLKKATRAPIKVDWSAISFQMNTLGLGGPRQIELKAKQEPLGKVLNRMLKPFNLCYVIVGESIVITTDSAGIYRQLTQEVTVKFRKVKFSEVMEDLGRRTAVQFVLDPKVGKAVDAPVSLSLEDVALETVIRLSAEMADLKPVRMGKVIYFTAPEKAVALRKEPRLVPSAQETGMIGAGHWHGEFTPDFPGGGPFAPPGVEILPGPGGEGGAFDPNAPRSR